MGLVGDIEKREVDVRGIEMTLLITNCETNLYLTVDYLSGTSGTSTRSHSD